MFRQTSFGVLLSLFFLGLAPAARAQWAVVDVGAIAELVQEVATMEQELTTAQAHLRQAQQEFQSITGSRGMQLLLSGTNRNYLPTNWAQLQAAATQPSGAYPVLSTNIQSSVNANAVLTPQQLAALSPAERNQIQAARSNIAMQQATATESLQTTSDRFSSLQQLINAIPTASDQKGILDLSARIAAEQTMLANEQTKMQVLYQAEQAQERALRQQAREQAISDIGSLRRLPAMGL
ncbi:MAG TPA: type IV secretion system protein [Steroidobacteraceae bacterium]|jgi:type IV secretion system protein VirB5